MSEEIEEIQGEEQGQVAEESVFDFGSLNEKFETSFEDESSFKSVIEKAGQIDSISEELNSYKNNYTSLEEKYNTIVETYDPEKYGNENLRALVELQDKYQGKDPGLIAQIRGSDFENMNPLDKLVLADKLNTNMSGMSDSVIKNGILKSMGIEDANDLSDEDRYALMKAVSVAEKDLSEIRDYKPSVPSIQQEWESREQSKAQRVSELTDGLTPLAKRVSESYSGYSLKGDVDYGYSISNEDKQACTDEALKWAISEGLDPNDASTSEHIQSYVSTMFLSKNIDKIVSDAYKQGAMSSQKKVESEVDNGQQMNRKESPSGGSRGGGNLYDRVSNNKK